MTPVQINLSNRELAKLMIEGGIYSHRDAIVVLQQIVKKRYPAISNLQLTKFVEKRYNAIWNEISQIINEYDSLGVCPCVRQSTIIPDRLVGCGIPKSIDDAFIKGIKRKLGLRPEIAQIVKGLNDDQFEKLIGLLFILYECDNVIIRQRTHDKGIDATAEMMIGTNMRYKGYIQEIKLRFVAQAKHEKEKIEEDVIRTFNTRVEDVKSNKEGYVVFDSEMKKYDCIVPIFFSTSGFEKTAKDKAREYGIITRNLIQIVEDITWLGDPFFSNSEGHIQFDSNRLYSILDRMVRKKPLNKSEIFGDLES